MHAEAVKTDDELTARLTQMAKTDRPGVLDLFSGCGGMTLGFHHAGFRPLAGVESDPHAARSHAENFHRELKRRDAVRFELFAQARDIRETDPHQFLEELGIDPDDVHVIIGGPPCPAFTRVGRAKLRQVHAHPEAYKNDDRWTLYRSYLKFVEALRPLALVMENVPDIINFGGDNVAEDIAETLEDLGYRASYTLLNAVHYGVPQMRDRFILVAVRKELEEEPVFPPPTHHHELPKGYHSSRSVALRTVPGSERSEAGTLALSLPGNPASEERSSCFVAPPMPEAGLQTAVTVEDALDDLPFHRPAPRGVRRLDEPVDYTVSARSEYAKLMREWEGFSTQGAVTAHVTRKLSSRDDRLFELMQPGDDYPAAHRLATRLFEEAVREAGGPRKLGSKAVEKLKRQYVPPYDVGKFPNKWRKMDPALPARTLMAHLGKDSYTHIHYDSAQHRVLTVREAARLQSFPDGFQFCGSMNPGFRQIGNAVPPLLAFAIAEQVRQLLERGIKSLLDRPAAWSH